MQSVVHLSRTCSLEGRVVHARKSPQPVQAFLGIPFAQPPIGKLRFQAPVPIPLWEGLRSATDYGPICPQNKKMAARSHFPFPLPEAMSEDCLYLNVWTPSLNETDKLPVMFWIYGGAFLQGFSNYYDGTVYAAKHNVVFVSINYRVGPFGFLSTGDSVVPGNAGLLDQVEALKWVRKHIPRFGGDPENITIFGESAGAISASLHLCSPVSKGLFRRVICQSGAAIHPMSVWPKENARKYIMTRAKSMDFKGSTTKEMVEFLGNFSNDDLVEKLGGGFAPVIDDIYMPRQPELLYDPRQGYPVPLLIGFNSHEGAQYTFDLAKSRVIKEEKKAMALLEHIIKKMFFRGSPQAEQILRLASEEYLMNSEDYAQSLTDLYGDLLFIAPSIRVAGMHSDLSPTFVYKYSYRISLSQHPEWVHADHGQEVPLVVGEPELDRLPDVWTEEDRGMSTLLRTYWTNFARTGNPNAHGLPQWPSYDEESKRYLNLDMDTRSEVDYSPRRMNFWNETINSLVKNTKNLVQSKH